VGGGRNRGGFYILVGEVMTERERATKHLRHMQQFLADMRRIPIRKIDYAESVVLAALSWVWDAQEREEGGQS
jgi:hypothetical protein